MNNRDRIQPSTSNLQSPTSNLQSLIRNLRLYVLLALLAACAPVTPPPTLTPAPTLILTPTPTLTPSPTPAPSPTPTVTPIPPLRLTIRWPEQVSALQPVPIEVELVPPPGIPVTATVRAAVVAPEGQYRWPIELRPREGNLYAAEELLQLPLEPQEGDWRLVVHVRSALKVEGEQRLVFRPAPIRFRDLTGVLPAGVDLRVPQEFVEAVAQGDQWAGGRVWRYGDSEVALWWAPGPDESLLLDNAIVMLEATHDPGEPSPVVVGVTEMEWQGQTAFLFHEDWPAGPSEALVVQGPDYRLYVLRVRTTGGETIPPLPHQVWETFTFHSPEG